MSRFTKTSQIPRLAGKREKPLIEWPEVLCMAVMMLLAFIAGVAFWMRITDGRGY